MQRKGDAGAASLKKVPTQLLKERLKSQLVVLDERIHLAKLHMNNSPYADRWIPLDDAIVIAANIQATYRELRGRPDRRW